MRAHALVLVLVLGVVALGVSCRDRAAFEARRAELDGEILKLDQQLQHAAAFAKAVRDIRARLAKIALVASGISATINDGHDVVTLTVTREQARHAILFLGDVIGAPIVSIVMADDAVAIGIARIDVKEPRTPQALPKPGILRSAWRRTSFTARRSSPSGERASWMQPAIPTCSCWMS
jgi:hypothetical protein